MDDYTSKQMEYIRGVDGRAHINAVEIIGQLQQENERLKLRADACTEQRDKLVDAVLMLAMEAEKHAYYNFVGLCRSILGSAGIKEDE